MSKQIVFLLLLSLPYWILAQIDGPLVPISTDEASPLGIQQFQWACVANFKLSDPKNQGRIKYLDTDDLGNIYIIDNNAYLYALDGSDFTEKWKTKLPYEHVTAFQASPNGKTLAICYNYIKSGTKKLEVRKASNGRIRLKIKRVPWCYDPSYFVDVGSNTTLYPSDIAYSPDGEHLAVWFKNHGFDANKCQAHLEEQFIIMSPYTGDVSASRNHIAADFETTKCESEYPFTWSPDNKHIYISNCRAEVIKYDTAALEPIQSGKFGLSLQRILTEKLNDRGSKKLRFAFHQLAVQQNGDLLTSTGKNGRIFKIDSDLSKIEYITQNQGTQDGHFSFSPDGAMSLFNSDQINLWNLNSKQPVLYTPTPHSFDAHTVRFHPTKQAIIVGTKRTLKILAPCKVSELEIGKSFTTTGHYLNPETAFSVRGKGRIYWSFDDHIIYHKYAKEDLISTEPLGFSSLFNNKQNIPQAAELRIKTDQPGTYTIFGGFSSAMTDLEVLQSLNEWAIKP